MGQREGSSPACPVPPDRLREPRSAEQRSPLHHDLRSGLSKGRERGGEGQRQGEGVWGDRESMEGTPPLKPVMKVHNETTCNSDTRILYLFFEVVNNFLVDLCRIM